MYKHLLLGLCPIGKTLFSHEDAIIQKQRIKHKLECCEVSYIDLEVCLQGSNGLVREQSQVEQVVKYLKEKNIDALFMPHCNFGTEGAAGIIAKEMGLPTLLWGPRDDAPLSDGTRQRDSLCGLFASSKVLNKLIGNKFTYIENCHLETATFKNGLSIFLGASSVVKTVQNMKIGLVGSRIDFFWSCIVNESELLEEFGIQIIPFEMDYFINEIEDHLSNEHESLNNELNDIKTAWLNTDNLDEKELIKGIAAAKVIINLCAKHKLSSITIQDFFGLANYLGEGSALYSMLASEIFPVANESDIHGAISLALLNAVKTGEEPVFFPEFTARHPTDDNNVLLWHVGAPASIRDPGQQRIDILPPWILPGNKPVQAQVRLKNGTLTICRFDGNKGKYRIGLGNGELVAGPYTRDYYGWLKVDNWPKWERQLIEGPYIHHCAAAYGNYTDIIAEAGKYLDIEVEIFGSSADCRQM